MWASYGRNRDIKRGKLDRQHANVALRTTYIISSVCESFGGRHEKESSWHQEARQEKLGEGPIDIERMVHHTDEERRVNDGCTNRLSTHHHDSNRWQSFHFRASSSYMVELIYSPSDGLPRVSLMHCFSFRLLWYRLARRRHVESYTC